MHCSPVASKPQTLAEGFIKLHRERGRQPFPRKSRPLLQDFGQTLIEFVHAAHYSTFEEVRFGTRDTLPMVTREEMLICIEEAGIIPAVRVGSSADAMFASEAVFSGGIPIVEIPVTVPDAISVISSLARSHADVIIGAGSILDLETARACLDAGASFLTTTGLDPEIVGFAFKHEMSIIPGALTPSEVMLAKRAGADFIKIFPCFSMGGPAYIRCLKAPFPKIRMIASGGVTQQNASDYIRAGAIVLGIGEDLLPRDAIRGRNSDWIRELARRFKQMVKEARHRDGGN